MNTGNINEESIETYQNGILSVLDTYNYLQDMNTSEIDSTIIDRLNLISTDNIIVAKSQIDIRNTGIIPPKSLSEQIKYISYTNASDIINIINKNKADIANNKYNSMNDILNIFREISHSAYLTNEASKIYTKSQIDASYIIQRTNLPNEINSTNIPEITLANSATADASGNAGLYLSRTVVLLENTQILINNISNKLILILAFNIFVQSLEKTLFDSLSKITGSELLSNPFTSSDSSNNPLAPSDSSNNPLAPSDSSNNPLAPSDSSNNPLIPSDSSNNPLIPSDSSNNPVTFNIYSPNTSINDALTISSLALICLNNFIASIKENSGITDAITNSVLEVTMLSNNFYSISSMNNKYADAATLVAIEHIEAINNTRNIKIPISIINTDSIPDPIISDVVIAARNAKTTAIISGITASNAQAVSNALIDLKLFYYNVTNIDSDIINISLSSLDKVIKVLTSMNTLITNRSINLVILMVNRVSNTIHGELTKINEDIISSNNYASDIYNVYTSITSAISAANTTIPTSIMSTQNLVWIVNSITQEVERQTNIAKDQALSASKNAHDLVTPRSIAIQTYSANINGISIINNVSRIFRNSSSSNIIKPVPYTSFKAGIRAKNALLPIYNIKSNIVPPLRSVNNVLENVITSTQRLKDMSRVSFRQQ